MSTVSCRVAFGDLTLMQEEWILSSSMRPPVDDCLACGMNAVTHIRPGPHISVPIRVVTEPAPHLTVILFCYLCLKLNWDSFKIKRGACVAQLSLLWLRAVYRSHMWVSVQALPPKSQTASGEQEREYDFIYFRLPPHDFFHLFMYSLRVRHELCFALLRPRGLCPSTSLLLP